MFSNGLRLHIFDRYRAHMQSIEEKYVIGNCLIIQDLEFLA